jgi:enoyl-CoA hydratase/carnithine racemase
LARRGTRRKWLLWSGETIDAATALRWGVVTEVLPHDKAMARGHEIATMLAGKPEAYRRLQKQTLNQKMRQRIVEGVSYGMALEGLTAARLGRS